MSAEKKIKLQANEILSNNNWVSAVSAVMTALVVFFIAYFFADMVFALLDTLLLYFAEYNELIGFACQYFNVAYALLFVPAVCLLLLFAMPLFLGVMRYFYMLAKNADAQFAEVFCYSGKRYFPALKLCLSLLLRCMWRILLPLSPGVMGIIVMTIITANKGTLAFSDKMCYFIFYACIFIGILAAVRLTRKYFLSIYLYFEKDYSDLSRLLADSEDFINPLKDSVPRLVSSLFGWILLCITVIPIIFVIPYVLTCLSISAKWIISLKLSNKEE